MKPTSLRPYPWPKKDLNSSTEPYVGGCVNGVKRQVGGGSAASNPLADRWLAISVPVGCASWVVFITTVLHYGRHFVNLAVLCAVNIFGGLMMCGFGARLLWQALLL